MTTDTLATALIALLAFVGVIIIGIGALMNIPARTANPPKQALSGLLLAPVLLAISLTLAAGVHAALGQLSDTPGGGSMQMLADLIQNPAIFLLVAGAVSLWLAAVTITTTRLLALRRRADRNRG